MRRKIEEWLKLFKRSLRRPQVVHRLKKPQPCLAHHDLRRCYQPYLGRFPGNALSRQGGGERKGKSHFLQRCPDTRAQEESNLIGFFAEEVKLLERRFFVRT